VALLFQPALPVALTRSRPYRKNGQAHVEQKNWTHVRQLLGYQRLESPDLPPPSTISIAFGACCTTSSAPA
jgi:hypothetical protein